MRDIKNTIYITRVFKEESYKDWKNWKIDIIDRRDLLHFFYEILNCCAESDMESLEKYDKFFYYVNLNIDEFISTNSEQIQEYYNYISLNLMSNLIHAYLEAGAQSKEFELLFKNGTVNKIIHFLNESGTLTQSELAKKIGITPQNLSNQLADLKGKNIFRKFKSGINKRETYYSLTADCKKYLNSHPVPRMKENEEKSTRKYIIPIIQVSRPTYSLSKYSNRAAATIANSVDKQRPAAMMSTLNKKYDRRTTPVY